MLVPWSKAYLTLFVNDCLQILKCSLLRSLNSDCFSAVGGELGFRKTLMFLRKSPQMALEVKSRESGNCDGLKHCLMSRTPLFSSCGPFSPTTPNWSDNQILGRRAEGNHLTEGGDRSHRDHFGKDCFSPTSEEPMVTSSHFYEFH